MSTRGNVWAVFLVIVLVSVGPRVAASLRSQTSHQAYVSLLYGDEFLLGVRVLGKSIRDTGSKKDMVVLVSDGVSDYAKKLLRADGWIVEKITLVANPNHVHPKRFWGVYTKLNVFNMTSYSKVVYLDADTIVVKNIEDLFKCGKFCANLKHSERLNSGVMVVEPSKTVFNDMMSKVKNLYSYTGGDQGFLNSYYSDFPNAHLFDPNLSEAEINSRPVPEMERLSTLYNADVGLYMLANKWMVDESELRVIHYTLGPLKPWDWWTSWLLKPVDVWQNVRDQLEGSLPGTRGGRNANDDIRISILYLIPLFAIFFCNYWSFHQRHGYSNTLCRTSLCDYIKHLYCKVRSPGALAYNGFFSAGTIHPHNEYKVPTYLGGISICACFMIAVIALALSLVTVPRQVTPWTGLLLMYEWTFAVFFLLFGFFLHLIFQWGKATATATQAGSFSPNSESFDSSAKDHLRQVSYFDTTAWFYGIGMAFLALAAPLLPCVFGITALFVRLGLMVVGGLILASFMTCASEHLAVRSFLRGLEDRDTARGRSICYLCH